MLEAFAVSTLLVAVAEIGDKTQLLSLVLAARFRQPLPIIAGIIVATLANHAVAAALGQWVHAALPAATLRWILGVSFLAVALWAIKPDKLDGVAVEHGHRTVFVITTIAFFLAEIGDKTQVATIMLAARFNSLVAVVAGTTLGMLAANVPAVLLGSAMTQRLPLKAIRYVAALMFAALGVATLLGYAL